MNTQARPRHPAQLEQVGYQQLRTARRTAMQLCLCCLSASLALLSLPTVPSQTHGQPASSGFCTHRPWPHPKLSLQKLHLKPLAGLSSSQRNAVRPLQGRLRCPAAGPARRQHTLHTRQQTPIDTHAPRACKRPLPGPHRSPWPGCTCRLWPPRPRTLLTHRPSPQPRGRLPAAEHRTRRPAQGPRKSRDSAAGSYDDLMRRIGSEGGGRGGLQPLVPAELKADVHKVG